MLRFTGGDLRVSIHRSGRSKNHPALEVGGVKHYNAAIETCLKAKDSGSREVLEHILVESEHHVDWLESQLNVIKEAGLQNYLAEQLGGD